MAEETPTWTVEEARAYLPRLRGLVAILRRATQLSTLARANGHSELPDRTMRPEAGLSEASAELDPREMLEEDDLPWGVSPRQAMEELSERGVIMRDPSRGLVDFPSRAPSGRVVLLCWQYGEDDLSFWHLPEDGFAGRRPLPVPPDI